ncbi:MAG TPA: nucleotide sugar dehydrogenase [Rhodospirillaceae bacterium]|jgi:UDP-N-acetyl-D-glucosamine dehydrogenase|nr:nucleotide sugar dehydrogenase [Alphaproteobacteria bacterium]HBH26815.1 nucleotide sugar dehydrogenase [Rhodospirillaceae bacterium]
MHKGAQLQVVEGGACDPYAALKAKVETQQITIGVIGLGYVGLPLSIAAVRGGVSVLGFDIAKSRVDMLNQGGSFLKTIGAEAVQGMVDSGRFEATATMARLSEPDILIICVPTPLSRNREPDLTHVRTTAETIAQHLRPGQLVCLESTTYPGTTDEVIRTILERSGLRSGEDFFLAYSPEREDPGNLRFSTGTIPKVVGGQGERATELATAVYSLFIDKVVPASSERVAEAVKLTENIFRSVNIALVNELKVIFGQMGIDVWEVIEAAKTKPFGYMPFYPGPGLGGHCIPVDPFYLTWKAREYGISTRFIELAGEINRAMPAHVAQATADALNRHLARALNGARVLVVGVAYKRDIDDWRESPALDVIRHLRAAQARVDYHDPHIPVLDAEALGGKMQGVAWDLAALAAYDAAVVCTDHSDIDWQALANAVPLVIDTRNALAGVEAARGVVVKA